MSDENASAFWLVVVGYLSLGLLVYIGLSLGGMARLDPLAKTAPRHVKLVLAPGMIGLWPLLVWRLIQRTAPEDRS